MGYKKKLIEVALPLEAINLGSKPETENPFLKGHPRAVHNWWARTPLSVARAILFAQLVDDPGDDVPTAEADAERERLLGLVSRLATWEAASDTSLIEEARAEIRRQFGGSVPEFWDMFAGRASIPLEAQRLGLPVTSSDLNPVAVTIQRALLEYPQRFMGRAPVHPDPSGNALRRSEWPGVSGLMDDIRWYGERVRQEGEKVLGRLYPAGVNGERTVAWLWARSVRCPSPACGAQVPLVRSYALAQRRGTGIWIEPRVSKLDKTVNFDVRAGDGSPMPGTVRRTGARCPVCGDPFGLNHVRDEGKAGRIGQQLLAVVAQVRGDLVYLPPTPDQVAAAGDAVPRWMPDTDLPLQALGFRVQLYGMKKHADLFTRRQLAALTALCDIVGRVREEVLDQSGGDVEYAGALTTYLACALSRLTDYTNNLCTWNSGNENVGHLFQRQAVPIVWDFVEANPIYGKLSFAVAAGWVASGLEAVAVDAPPARVLQLDARGTPPLFGAPPVVSTDPPYYDNIGYADLSDFFYTWLRPMLRRVDPQTFATLLSPKEPELIASPYRHDGSPDLAERHFRDGFQAVCANLYASARGDVPSTIYYAFKQQEDDEDEAADRRASTGWETMLEGLVTSGFQITGTWPVRTTKKARSVARDANALASAIVIVARRRPAHAPLATRREFTSALRRELPDALLAMMESNIAPVDLAQASIGPGMAVFSRYAKVLEADGSPMSVRTALQIINQELDAHLAAQEGEMDGDTRFCVAWFEQYGMSEGPFGEADVLARAKNTSAQGLADAGVADSRAGKVRLLKRSELPAEWDPIRDQRLTTWEATQHLIRRLEEGGEEAAAALCAQLGSWAGNAHSLAYRLYNICERKGWADDARAYNSLVVSWPNIIAGAGRVSTNEQQQMEI